MSTILNLPLLGIPTYPTASALPATASHGALAVVLDVNSLYEFNGTSWVAIATPGASTAIDGLTGDVSASGPGVVAATVNSVGGQNAANIALATSEVLAGSFANVSLSNLASPTALNRPLRGSNGSVSAPTYAFTGSTNSGMYYDGGHGALAFAFAGTEFIYLNASGPAGNQAVLNADLQMSVDGSFSIGGSGTRPFNVFAANGMFINTLDPSNNLSLFPSGGIVLSDSDGAIVNDNPVNGAAIRFEAGKVQTIISVSAPFDTALISCQNIGGRANVNLGPATDLTWAFDGDSDIGISGSFLGRPRNMDLANALRADKVFVASQFQINMIPVYPPGVTFASGDPYTQTPTDLIIEVDTTGSPRTINLLGSNTIGQILYIKDYTGNAGTNHITIVPNGTNIDGMSSAGIATNYGVLRLYFDGSQWYSL